LALVQKGRFRIIAERIHLSQLQCKRSLRQLVQKQPALMRMKSQHRRLLNDRACACHPSFANAVAIEKPEYI
jgi:hypothetical protein